MIRFYAPDIASTGMLPESDSQHCCRVLRMRSGDLIEVVDGRGGLYSCRITVPDQRHTEVEIVSHADLPVSWPAPITIAVAPTKNIERMEWLVEKLVEVGVDRIVPVRCARSERKEIKAERLRKIAVSAMKQSLKAVLPEISDMMPLAGFISNVRDDRASKFVAYCDSDMPRKLLSKEYQAGSPAIMLIGPEGDFSPEEVAWSIAAGFMSVSLGDNRLRTETAALVACDTCHIINQASFQPQPI